MKGVNIVLLGFGNVGRAFLQVLQEKKDFCLSRYGLDFRLHSVFRQAGAALLKDVIAIYQRNA